MQSQVKLTETANSFIVEYGEITSDFLKKNPMAFELAKMKMEEYEQRAKDEAALITHLLAGRDLMLIPIQELVEFARIGGQVGSYFNGIIYARRTLVASGVETTAA